MMKNLLFICFSILTTGLFAQTEKCGTRVTPAMVKAEKAALDSGITSASMFLPNTCLEKTLSVTAIFVADSAGNYGTGAGAVNAMLSFIEPYFEPICVKFELCEIVLVENYKYDDFLRPIDQDEFLTLYSIPNTINIGFVSTLQIDVGQVVAGYAALPGGPDIIMMTNGVGGGVLLHEMGHFMGLYHTFEDSFGLEFADGSNCLAAGDLLCDTPADPNGTNTPPPDCNLSPALKDPNGDWYVPDISNIMSYYSGCECGQFTTDQYNWMANKLLTVRNYLW